MKISSILCSAVAVLALATLTAPPLALARSPIHVARPHKIHGIILSVAPDETSLQFKKRNGVVQTVDLTEAQANQATGMLPVGDAVVIFGYRNPDGSFHAQNVGHVSQNAAQWDADD